MPEFGLGGLPPKPPPQGGFAWDAEAASHLWGLDQTPAWLSPTFLLPHPASNRCDPRFLKETGDLWEFSASSCA